VKPEKQKNGVAIILVMCFILVLTVMATVASRSISSQVLIEKHQVNAEKSFYIAEAGAERGAAHVANGGTIPYSFDGKIGGGTYHVTITGKATTGEGSGTSVNGLININPNNSPSFEFTLTLPNGTVINRDTLHQHYAGYTGPATSIHVKPKGNGNQNSLTIDGQTYPLNNSTAYSISSSSMNVVLFNDHINRQGKAVGRWFISIGATDASITP
jgi:Tfp pilus assembly protein PilX